MLQYLTIALLCFTSASQSYRLIKAEETITSMEDNYKKSIQLIQEENESMGKEQYRQGIIEGCYETIDLLCRKTNTPRSCLEVLRHNCLELESL